MEKIYGVFSKIKWSLILSIILIIFNSTQCLANTKEFPDMQKHWAKPYIIALAEKGYISGMQDGLFHPDELMTFQQYITIIISSKYGKQNPINEQFASGYMKLALEKGIIGETDMLNDGPLTRLNAAKVGHLALLNIFDEQDEIDTSVAMQLTDFPNCKSCRVHIEQCYTKGIITGRPGLIFDGDSNLTRAEGCTIIIKLLDHELRMPPQAAANSGQKDDLLSAKDVMDMISSDKKVILLDVRDQNEHKLKYIPDSICIPLQALKDSNAEQLADKDATIIVYCQSGGRSLQAYKFLQSLGYSHVFNIGGIDKWPYDTKSDTEILP